MSDDGLNAYQIAYVCGGPVRVAMVAVVGLYEDGQIAIARARHRVTVRERAQDDPVRAAVVAAVPEAGRVLGSLLDAVAGSAAVAEIRGTLFDRGLLPASRITRLWPSPRARAARGLRGRLVAGLPAEADDPRRVATMGAAGIGDPVLREIFETPDPDLRTRPVRPPSGGPDSSGYRTPDRSADFIGMDPPAGP